jgi:CRP-like cAMP-binding protein
MRLSGGESRASGNTALQPIPIGRICNVLERFRENRLLAALTHAEGEALARSSHLVELPSGAVVCEAGEEAEQIYFPLTGAVSLLVVLEHGKTLETATVGHDGVVSAMAGFGLHVSQVRAVVQSRMTAVRISSAAFRRLTASHRSIQDLCVRYNEILLAQARTIAACNNYHTVQQRFCRWVLLASDRVSPNDMRFTQESVAELLGARRSSVSDVASKLSSLDVLSYSRGIVVVNDRASLRALSCECYATILRLAPP